jgi:hypothetical protein
MLAQRVLDLVQAALPIAKCIERFQIRAELFPLRSRELVFHAADIVADEIEQIVLRRELLLRHSAGHAAEKGSVCLVRLDHVRQRFIGRPGRDVIQHAVFQPLRNTETEEGKYAGELLR